MTEKETKSCSDCIHFDVCYKIEHFGRDLEDTSPCKQFISKDVAPVRHGYWKRELMSPKIGLYAYICSNCKKVTHIGADKYMDYCGNCGAKMDGGDLNGS